MQARANYWKCNLPTKNIKFQQSDPKFRTQSFSILQPPERSNISRLSSLLRELTSSDITQGARHSKTIIVSRHEVSPPFDSSLIWYDIVVLLLASLSWVRCCYHQHNIGRRSVGICGKPRKIQGNQKPSHTDGRDTNTSKTVTTTVAAVDHQENYNNKFERPDSRKQHGVWPVNMS